MRPGINEGVRWVGGYERAAGLAMELPQAHPVYMAGREGGPLPPMQKANPPSFAADLLMRGKHNRVLATGEAKPWG